MILIAILIAVLLAENICLFFYFRVRPDRAIRLAEKEKYEFLTGAALKLLNRAWGVQGAPAMDDEFDDEEEAKPALSNRAIDDLMPEEAQVKLEEMREELAEIEGKRHGGGPVARRRKLVGDMRRLEANLAAKPPRPNPGPVGGVPYMNTLEPEDTAHLEALREN